MSAEFDAGLAVGWMRGYQAAMDALPSPLLVKQESLLFHIGLDNT